MIIAIKKVTFKDILTFRRHSTEKYRSEITLAINKKLFKNSASLVRLENDGKLYNIFKTYTCHFSRISSDCFQVTKQYNNSDKIEHCYYHANVLPMIKYGVI